MKNIIRYPQSGPPDISVLREGKFAKKLSKKGIKLKSKVSKGVVDMINYYDEIVGVTTKKGKRLFLKISDL